MSVIIETTLGDLTVDLYIKERHNTCLNFLKLCKMKYYNLSLFHKIEKNFIAQSGDPSGTGRGGESIFCCLYGDQAKYFDSEFKPRLKHEKSGTISMVNNGNNMNGSQFFLTLGENLTYLDDVHTVFGEVVEGFDTLLKLNEAICDGNNRPYQDIRITHTVILHDPFDDPAGLDIPDASPEPTKEQLESGYIAADEEIDDTKGKNAEEIEEKIKESEARARATVLEMVGDIPDADVKPPENVLFVCKLNPVTTSEDLEIIFSRFGQIVSCEVIKDRKTDESLQYAFIEFEKEEDCENAYFKMDNVVIDDRRIHVDFSQSVSKMNWDKDGKFPSSKRSKDTVVLKNASKRSDGYDLIFDLNTSDDASTRRDARQISKSPEKRHSHASKKEKREERYFRDRSRSESPVSKRRKHSTDYCNISRHKSYTDKSHRSNSSKRYHDNVRNYSPDFHSRNRKYPSKYYSHKEYDSEHRNRCSYSPNRSYKCSDKDKNSAHHEEPSKVSRSFSYSTYRERKKTDDVHKEHSSSHSKKSYDSGNVYQSKDKKCKSSHKESRRSCDYSPQNKPSQKKSHKKKRSHRSVSASSSSSSSVLKHSRNSETSSESSCDDTPYEKNKQYQRKKNVHADSYEKRRGKKHV